MGDRLYHLSGPEFQWGVVVNEVNTITHAGKPLARFIGQRLAVLRRWAAFHGLFMRPGSL